MYAMTDTKGSLRPGIGRVFLQEHAIDVPSMRSLDPLLYIGLLVQQRPLVVNMHDFTPKRKSEHVELCNVF